MPLARVRGVVEEKGDDWVIVGVGGIGLMASVPVPTAARLGIGAAASLFTYLHVREDALTLFGFASADDLHLFEQLIGVNGVGPRVALALLSALEHPQLMTAIASGHADQLRKVPGVGQKTAERIVLELRDKVLPPAGGYTAEAEPPAKRVDPEALAALMGLGYTQAEASAALEQLPEDGDLPLEERVRLALQYFAKV